MERMVQEGEGKWGGCRMGEKRQYSEWKYTWKESSRADIVELRNFFTVESESKLSERDHHWYHGCSFPRGYI